jgi:hypothetical protein
MSGRADIFMNNLRTPGYKISQGSLARIIKGRILPGSILFE